MAVHAVVLCGGRGERFWPASRRSMPKQFLRLFGSKSLTRQTSERISAICPLSRQLFVLPQEFVPLITTELRPLKRNLLLEPCGRNTATAIALAAIHLLRRDPDGVMVVLPADHLITRQREFLCAVRFAIKVAERGLLVTFGITPTRPDTGYGYVHFGRRLAGTGQLTAHEVICFREKPDANTARRYLREGKYLWNSGIFVWKVDKILAAFRQFLPEFHAELVRHSRYIGTAHESQSLRRLYSRAPSVSIDYAVLEKAENIAVVRPSFNWDDVGSWLALARHLPLDHDGNVRKGHVVLKNTHCCIIDAGDGLVACLGVHDLAIIRAGASVLVARKDSLADMKELLFLIAQEKGGENYL